MSAALLQSSFAQRGVQRAFVSAKPNSRVSRISAAKMTTAALSQDELKKQVSERDLRNGGAFLFIISLLYLNK